MRTISTENAPPDRIRSSVGDLDGTKPITNRDSRMVMLRGERRDELQVDEVVEMILADTKIPPKFEIVQRTSTYHGTELLLNATQEDQNCKYLLTAPGPDAFLYLWLSETDQDGFRIGWSKIAEIKASFSDELPQYPICEVCGEPIKSLEHERLAMIDKCDRLAD